MQDTASSYSTADFSQSAFAVYNPAFGQIIRRQLDTDAVTWNDANKVLAHSAGDMGHNDVSTFDLNAKTGIGKGLSYNALDLKCFFLLFCHTRFVRRAEHSERTNLENPCLLSPQRFAESYNRSIRSVYWSSRIESVAAAGLANWEFSDRRAPRGILVRDPVR